MRIAASRRIGHHDELRHRFRSWLVGQRFAPDMTLRLLMEKFGRPISVSSAYRIAVTVGLRGRRRNRTRYQGFWDAINWELPDSTLSRIWGVTRGNLRQRRVRLAAGPPRFDA